MPILFIIDPPQSLQLKKDSTLLKEKKEALKRLSSISRNIEARVKRPAKQQRKSTGKLCACLLKAGKGMKKKEREAALASGALVCTCPT